MFNYTDAILKSGLSDYGDGWSWYSKEDNQFYFNMPDPKQDILPPAPAGAGAGSFASTDPSFGIKPNEPKPTGPAPTVPTRPGAPGAAAGVPMRSNVIPTSDLLEHTLRNIGPSLRPGNQTISPEIAPGVRPGSVQPTIMDGERGSGPQVRGLSIAPTSSSGGPATIKRDIRFGRRNV